MDSFEYLFCLVAALIFSTFGSDAVLTFNDVNYNGVSADRYDWSKHPCIRTCKTDEPPKICNYVFVVEELSSMGKACYRCPLNITDCFRPHCMPADGAQKKIVVVNRQLPGTSIEVCQNDTIVVEVRNRMASQSTTVHWHGIKQNGSPYMDGVPFVTQCPIPPGDSFTYIFNATSPGTYFWHSHIGQQRHDGHFGNLIVNVAPENNPHVDLYDVDEHRMIVADWINEAGDDNFIREFQQGIETYNATFLINGLGPTIPHLDVNGTSYSTPYAILNVDGGKRYRFRLINSGAIDCPIELSIDNHTLTVISLDSNDIEPVTVDKLVSWPGERYDFVVNANQTADNYWVRYRGFGRCQRNATHGVFQGAILRYRNSIVGQPKSTLTYALSQTTKKHRVLNPYNRGTESSQKTKVSIPNLNSIISSDDELTLKKDADEQIYMSFDFYHLDNFNYHRAGLYGYDQVPKENRIGSLQLNHISLELQPFPLLSQYEQIKPGMLCNSSTINVTKCSSEQCACTHVISVKLNSVVELIFVDEGALATMNHPLHLHGHFFRVVAEERLNGTVSIDRVKQLDEEGKIHRRLKKAPFKDTMKTPGGGYSIVRFLANNPGYWFFHCHFEDHMQIGMALVFKVGEHEDFPEKPDNFPRCGTFTPRFM